MERFTKPIVTLALLGNSGTDQETGSRAGGVSHEDVKIFFASDKDKQERAKQRDRRGYIMKIE